MPLPTMTHSSSFLLPSPPAEAAAAADAVAYAVIVLNQRLPRFASLLWTRGNESVNAPLSLLFPAPTGGHYCWLSLSRA